MSSDRETHWGEKDLSREKQTWGHRGSRALGTDCIRQQYVDEVVNMVGASPAVPPGYGGDGGGSTCSPRCISVFRACMYLAGGRNRSLEVGRLAGEGLAGLGS